MNVESTTSKKIVDLCIFLPSLAGGGAERVMVTIANHVSQYEYKVDLVLANATGPYLEEVSPNVKVIDLSCSGVMTALPGLINYLRKSRPKTLLAAMNHTNVIAAIACLITGKKNRLVLSERNYFGAHLNQTGSNKEKFLKPLMHWLYPKADKIICVSREIEENLASKFNFDREILTTIYNPVIDHHMINTTLSGINPSIQKPNHIPVIISAGRLTAQKNHRLLIEAFNEVINSRDAQLIIFGEGKLRASLEEQVKDLGLTDKVVLPGFKKNLFQHFKEADLFVLSSDYEGLPGVVIQAMACGLPIVSTNCPSGPAEILENGVWGDLVPVGDSHALSKAIITALNRSSHPDVRERAKYFSVTNSITHYLKELFPENNTTASQ